jgi:hypothetical protein
MKTVYGLDVHKSMIIMCILKENGTKIIQKFSTLTRDVESMSGLINWLKDTSIDL